MDPNLHEADAIEGLVFCVDHRKGLFTLTVTLTGNLYSELSQNEVLVWLI